MLCHSLIYSCLEGLLIKNILFLKIAVMNVWSLQIKKSKAQKKWHHKAMLVDPKKTEIKIIRSCAPEIYETEVKSGNGAMIKETAGLDMIDAPHEQVTREDLKISDLNFGKIENTKSLDDPTSTVAATEIDFEVATPNVVENLGLDEASETLENLNLQEGSNTIAGTDNLGRVDSYGTEYANVYEVAERAYELIASEKGPLNVKFLKALEKIRSKWYDEDFDEVYMHICTYC